MQQVVQQAAAVDERWQQLLEQMLEQRRRLDQATELYAAGQGELWHARAGSSTEAAAAKCYYFAYFPAHSAVLHPSFALLFDKNATSLNRG